MHSATMGLRNHETMVEHGGDIQMVYRVDVLVRDPDPVFQWVQRKIPRRHLVRMVAFDTNRGWYIKTVFERQECAEAFHRRWYPGTEDHSVPPW